MSLQQEKFAKVDDMSGRSCGQSCLVKNCSRIRTNRSELSYHKFPINPAQGDQWISFVTMRNLTNPRKWKCKASSRLCSRHFKKCCFTAYGKFRSIKPDHYPSIMVDFQGNFTETKESHIKPPLLGLTATNFDQAEILENLLEPALQKTDGLKVANKLTIRHSKFTKQKMKVKLAVQLLSSSVSVAFKTCERIGLPEFQGCSGTSYFAKMLDRIFDAINSHPGGKGYKAPLSEWNKAIWKKLFHDGKKYLMGLRRKSDNALLVHTKRSTCITGLIVCMTSLEAIIDDIVLPNNSSLKYLPTYKLSQDHLELFFSALRQRFGNNNNPNVLQLSFALKRMLAVNIQPNLNGNCIPQDETFTTKISPLNQFVQTGTEEFQNRDEVPFLPDYRALSSFVENIVAYIAGFVGRKVSKAIDCETCTSSLYPSNLSSITLRSDCILLSEKNNGGLFVPSVDLIIACKKTEEVILSVHQMGTRNLKSLEIVKITLRHLLQMNIFAEIRTVNNEEHTVFGDHVYKLLKQIITVYVKIRLNHIAKEASLALSSENIRNHLTKNCIVQGSMIIVICVTFQSYPVSL